MQTWSDEAFEQMSWHDCMVHGVHGFEELGELRFDIDYITEWVPPEPGGTYFSFWIAPATLVFRRAHDVHVHLEPPDFGNFVIMRVHRQPTPHDGVFEFRVETLGGEIRLYASGFTQFLRSAPALCGQQYLELQERGGVSFETPRAD